MALRPCRECGKEVSTEAATCPHCGVQRPVGERGRCYGCGETVTVVDSFCPLCGVNDPLVPFAEAQRRRGVAASSPLAPNPKYAAMSRAASIFAGVSFVFFFAVLLFDGSSTPTGGDSGESSRKINVAIGCEQAIEQRLRSPRSARFPWNMSNEAVRQPDGSYVLRSYVDAQNGFGAEIRTNFVCRGTPTDGGVLVHEARLLN